MTDKIKESEKIQKFHQFVHVEKGPVNAAIIDLLKGNFFQVEKTVVEKFENRLFEEIPEFMEAAVAEGLIFDVNPKSWIPENQLDPHDKDLAREEPMKLEVHLDEGVNPDAVLEKLRGRPIYKIVYYGPEIPETRFNLNNIKIDTKEKNFKECIEMSAVDGDFHQITNASYLFKRRYNSCLGGKIAFTADGKIRPCIYSDIVVADFHSCDIQQVIDELEEQYWALTKDKVETCKDCELRHICFDCREIARRSGGELTSPNPHCRYDPYNGTWKE